MDTSATVGRWERWERLAPILLPVLLALAYTLLRLSYVTFYEHFGVTPEDVGLSRLDILTGSLRIVRLYQFALITFAIILGLIIASLFQYVFWALNFYIFRIGLFGFRFMAGVYSEASQHSSDSGGSALDRLVDRSLQGWAKKASKRPVVPPAGIWKMVELREFSDNSLRRLSSQLRNTQQKDGDDSSAVNARGMNNAVGDSDYGFAILQHMRSYRNADNFAARSCTG